MIPYPDISPDIVRIGPLTIRWYGMMYLLGFALSYFLVMRQVKKGQQNSEVLSPVTSFS